jgi:hypothetical protein
VFLREDLGKGSAWFVRLDESGQPITVPIQVSPPNMDIWSAQVLTSDGILLSGSENKRSHLILMRNGAAQRLFVDTDSVEALAIRPGSGPVVRQRKKNNYWQLYLSGQSGEGQTQLTFGDCNAYDPAWLDKNRLVYISDCGRGDEMGAVAEINVRTSMGAGERASTNAEYTSSPQGGARK